TYPCGRKTFIGLLSLAVRLKGDISTSRRITNDVVITAQTTRATVRVTSIHFRRIVKGSDIGELLHPVSHEPLVLYRAASSLFRLGPMGSFNFGPIEPTGPHNLARPSTRNCRSSRSLVNTIQNLETCKKN